MRQILGTSLNFLIYARRHLRFVDPLAAIWHGLRGTFSDMQEFILFLGNPRSGHTLVMALLDAHPEIMLANEVNLFGHLHFISSRNLLLWLLLANSQDFVRKGAIWQGYSYAVPGQWQGRARHLSIMGNKDAGATTRSLTKDTSDLLLLQEVLRVPIRIIHVVRNPYDNISTSNRRDGNNTLAVTTDRYIQSCETNLQLMAQFEDTIPSYTVHHEAIITNPAVELRNLCDFVGTEVSDSYLEACTSIVFESPNKSRYQTDWDDETRRRIEEAIEKYPFLNGYSFDS